MRDLFRGNAGGTTDEDELRSMGSYFRELMSDVTDTRSRLERSRMRLAAAEKLAAVGKLAATVAHEIRNPLTAMEMWLFAIQEQSSRRRRVGATTGHHFRRNDPLGKYHPELPGVLAPMELHCRPMEVNCIVQQTLDLFEQRLKDRNIRVASAGRCGVEHVGGRRCEGHVDRLACASRYVR